MANNVNAQILKKIKDTHIRNEALRSKTSNYFIQEDIFSEGARIPVPLKEVAARKPTIMVFADDEPLSNWAHPCRFLLYDAQDGSLYDEIHACFPPYPNESEKPKSFNAFHIAVSFPAIRKYPITSLVKFPYKYLYTGQRYAILFAGMSNNRHTNDLEFLYRTLVHVYGYKPANITVLNYNGTLNYDGNPHPVVHWPGDNTPYTMPVNGPGTKAALLSAIDSMKAKLKPDDCLLIHANNHGNGAPNIPESVICCQPNWDSLSATEFAGKIGELPKYNCLMVMMEQCFAGGFNGPVLAKSTANNTSVAAAADAYHSSAGGPEFDPFAFEWIAAMCGKDAYGHALAYNPDSDFNGKITSQEAFNYARANDPYDVGAHPVFSFAHNGNSCWLGQDIFWVRLVSSSVLQQIVLDRWPVPGPDPGPEKVQEVIQEILPQLQEMGVSANQEINSFVKQHEQKISKIMSGIKLN